MNEMTRRAALAGMVGGVDGDFNLFEGGDLSDGSRVIQYIQYFKSESFV